MQKASEIWKSVIGYEGLYEVSSFGKVRSLQRFDPSRPNRVIKGKPLNLCIDTGGYLYVRLCKQGKVKLKRVHTLVLEAFVIQRPLGYQGCHRNDVKDDNVLDNLYWGTKSENALDAFRNGGLDGTSFKKGKDNITAVLTEQEVRYILTEYIPEHSKFGQVALAKRFGVTRSCIGTIVRRENWKWVEVD